MFRGIVEGDYDEVVERDQELDGEANVNVTHRNRDGLICFGVSGAVFD